MVEYESLEHRTTERAPTLGAPPATTPLGSLLLEIEAVALRLAALALQKLTFGEPEMVRGPACYRAT